MSKNVRIEAVDPLESDPQEDAKLMAELEANLPAVIGMIGVKTFHALCKHIYAIAMLTGEANPIMIERNIAKDGAFLYVGTHSFDVVAAIRKEAGVQGTSDAALPAAIAEVTARRKERN